MPWRNNETPDYLAAHAASRRARPEKHQLKTWLSKPETHEQVVVGEKTSRSFAKTMHFLEEMEKTLAGDTK